MDLTSDISAVNLVINRVSREIYDYLCQTRQIHEDELYCVDEQMLDGRGNRIVNVAAPISASDAANKAYVDNSLSARSKVLMRDWQDEMEGT